eukprot:m.418981 g.418981  ORF g.418981 m.418981 type:complete len:79 (+) comp16836_c1_seq22:383-619(+)
MERCEFGELMQCSTVNGSAADEVGALPSLHPACTSRGGFVAQCAPQHRATALDLSALGLECRWTLFGCCPSRHTSKIG